MSEVKVKRKIIKGIQYLIDKDNNLYDADSQEHIGVYNPDTKEIIPVESDDEEEEELDENDYAERAKQKARSKMGTEEEIEFKVTLGDYPDWKKLGFTKIPEAYWNIDLWDNQADLLDYEGKKRFIFASKKLPINEDIDYQLLVKKDGKKIDPIAVVIDDKADEEMLLLFPNEEIHMFLQYFGNGTDITDNLEATGFIDTYEEEEEEEEEKVDVNLEKRKGMENVLRQLGDLYTRLKQSYQDDKTEAKLQEAQKAKKILQKKKQEYIDFVNSLDNEATKTQPTKVKFGTGIDNPALYEKAKEIVYKQYPKHSAYRSGQLVKKYKEMGGTYSGKKDTDGLTRWFKEEWKDIGNKEYPVYRPTKRITKDTPLTPEEIKPSNLRSQIVLKQKIKGNENLPPFQGKGIVVSLGQSADKISEYDEVYKYSNPKVVQEKAKKYLGEGATIFRSTKKDKKYMVYNPNDEKWVHFGQMKFEDFTKHKDEKRRKNYLTRTAGIKGDWKNDRYSPNNLSRNLLW